VLVTDIQVRLAQNHEYLTILSLMTKHLDSVDEDSLKPEDAQPRIEAIQNNPGQFVFVAVRDDAIIGTFMVIIVTQLVHGGSCSAIVEDVAVDEAAQGTGIGTRMMQYAADFARENGCYKIILSSNKARHLAHEFYRKLGYEQHGISFYLKLD